MKRVIKIGGRAQSSPELGVQIAKAWRDAPSSFCIVHGGGDRISEFQQRVGLEPSFLNGRRVTTSEDIQIVRMVLSGLVNKELVSTLIAASVPAVGISGEDAGMMTATSLGGSGLGRVGKPVSVEPDLINVLHAGGYLPVVSPLAVDDESTSGEPLNVNGDDAAAAIAIAIGASELLLVADVSGVLDAAGSPIASLDHAEAGELMEAGVISKGMRAKLEAGFAALSGGVSRVRISALDGVTDTSLGTRLTLVQSLIT